VPGAVNERRRLETIADSTTPEESLVRASGELVEDRSKEEANETT
jgi:hypothetical protein